MRRLLIACCFIAAFAATGFAMAAVKFPALTGRVVDDAHIISAENAQSLTARLAAHEQKTGEQIVVVTVPSLNGASIEDFGYQLGRAWGIGQKGKNNGALLIVAPQEHQTRIEAGYGMEGRLTDAACATIISRLMIPAFRAGDYNGGIVKGTNAVLAALGDPADGDAENNTSAALPSSSSDQNAHFPLLIFIVLIFWICFALRRRRSGLGPLVIGSMLGRSGGFGDGGGFGGGFSGGGGGFGGGGASGSW